MRAEPTAVAQIPDSRGINLYRADRDAAPLLQHYLPGDLFGHLEPKLDRLGALAGDRLDRLAAIADKNPPTLSVRLRTGQDADIVEKHPAYLEMEALAFGEFGLSAVSTEEPWDGPKPCRRRRSTRSRSSSPKPSLV